VALPARSVAPWSAPSASAGAVDGTGGLRATRPELHGDLDVDVAIIGAGITGLTTAVLLHRAGVRVAVLEARHVGAAATGNTSAKVSVLQGTRASTLASKHPQSVVDAYLDAHRAGLDWIAERAQTAECDFERAPAVTFSTDGPSGSGTEQVRAEAEALRHAGLPAQLGTDVGLPFEVFEAVTLPEQAQFDPVAFLADLARELDEAEVPFFEGTRARNVSLSGPPHIRTDHGRVRAERVILATGYPILDRALYFARIEPSRSYAQANRVEGDLPPGMYLSANSPTASIRTALIDGERLLLTGGFGHRVGASVPTSAHERELAEWTAARWPLREITHRWSAQDYYTEDGLPFVGVMPTSSLVFVATGFAKWGMTGGVAAAMALREEMLGRADPRTAAWNAHRVPQLNTLPTLAQANSEVARYMVTGWGRPDLPSSAPLAEGEGRVEATVRGKVGRCRVEGTEHEVSAVCPHLGGVVAWNDAAASWDCPLHASRFAPDGTVLEGPSTTGLGAPPGLSRVVAPRT
jgi:glycine/D-amino acid oxidase-like deaminating enzyme/nitrite reductase/ring-hydroxylating ferredoxin subunit